MASKAESQKLSRGDDVKFGQIVQCYERKDYKKGHRLAEEILKRTPDHGETQAMRGLLFNCQGERKEAYEWVKLGLRNNIRSHICWHVYGLIYRSDRNYKEATKCYMNALRINKGNQNIMRDLSYLQIQTRNYEGYISTRREILRTKPNVRSNWVATAMAYYANKDYATAFEVITKGNSVSETGGTSDYEIGEMLALQVECLAKQGKYEEGLEHIKEIESTVLDKLFLQQKTAEFLTLCGEPKREEARKAWLELLDDEPENYQYHCGLQCQALALDPETCLKMFPLTALRLPCTELPLSEGQRATLLDLYAKEESLMSDKYGALVVRKIKFTLLDGSALWTEMEAHIKACLIKGLPALYADVCNAVRVPDPTQAGMKVVVKHHGTFRAHSLVVTAKAFLQEQISSLRNTDRFTGDDPTSASQPPTALLWALFLKCHLHEASGEMEEALVYINECLAHTPTATDFFLKKAQILKHMGDLSTAASVADEGRALDLQDRYLNNKATKYFLRADNPKSAAENMSLFARYEGDPQQYLHEMQTNWFELEAAEAWTRKKQYGQCLKKFHSVKQHFVDYYEDMFDFHGFSVRKSTLRAHSDAIHMQDKVFGHAYFQRATEGALSVYLHLMDDPEDVDGLAHLPSKERKKERERRKKHKARDAKAEEERTQQALKEAEWMGAPKPQEGPKDPDPFGDTYLAKSFGDEAYSWAQILTPHLEQCSAKSLALISDVMVRRSKPLIALKVLTVGQARYPASPVLRAAQVRLAHRIVAPTTKSTKAMSKDQKVLEWARGQTAALLGIQMPLTRVKLAEWVAAEVALLPSSSSSSDGTHTRDREGAGVLWSGLEGREQLARCVLLCQGDDAGRGLVASSVLPLAALEALFKDPTDPLVGGIASPGSKAGNCSPRASERLLFRLADPRGAFRMSEDYLAAVRGLISGLFPRARFGALCEEGEGQGQGQGAAPVLEDLDDLPGLEKA